MTLLAGGDPAPIQVAIVEACLWIDEPLSPPLLAQVLDEPLLGRVAYSVGQLHAWGALRKVKTHYRRGRLERFYVPATEEVPTAGV